MDEREAESAMKLKWSYKLYLAGILLLIAADVTMGILHFTSVLDLEEAPFVWVERGFFAVFWLDYLLRFLLSKKKSKFFQSNFVELVSILPFTVWFCFLHLYRFFEILIFACRRIRPHSERRQFIALDETKRRIKDLLHVNGFIWVLEWTILFLLVCAFAICKIEEISFINALSFAISSFPQTHIVSGWSRVLEAILFLVKAGFWGMFIASAICYFIKNKKTMK